MNFPAIFVGHRIYFKLLYASSTNSKNWGLICSTMLLPSTFIAGTKTSSRRTNSSPISFSGVPQAGQSFSSSRKFQILFLNRNSLKAFSICSSCFSLFYCFYHEITNTMAVFLYIAGQRKTAGKNSCGFYFLILFTFYFLLASEQIPALIASLIPVQVFSPYSSWDFLFHSRSGLYLPA